MGFAAADDLMSLLLPKRKALLADKGYDGDGFRDDLLLCGILPIIPAALETESAGPPLLPTLQGSHPRGAYVR